MEAEPLIDLVDVERTFGSVRVLRPTRLRIDLGDHIAIVGRSGSGKSTLMHVLGLLDTPSAGRMWFGGRQVSELGEAERARIRAQEVSFVFQSFHLLGRRTVLENVQVGLLYQGTRARERRRRAYAALTSVGLARHADSYPRTLSGGERQRVAVARALARGSRLLLADEPTGSLDSGTTAQLLDTFDAIVGPSLALVVVTHDLEVAARAQRVHTMADGVLSDAAVTA